MFFLALLCCNHNVNKTKIIIIAWNTFLTFKLTTILIFSVCPLVVACSLYRLDMDVIGSTLVVGSHFTHITLVQGSITM